MDGPTDCHTKWSQTDKDKYQMISLYAEALRNDTNELLYKTETESQTQIRNLMVTWTEEWRGGIDWEFGIDMYTLLYLKYITNKDLLYSTENSAQYSVIL